MMNHIETQQAKTPPHTTEPLDYYYYYYDLKVKEKKKKRKNYYYLDSFLTKNFFKVVVSWESG